MPALPLAHATVRLIESYTGGRVPRPRSERLSVDHAVYGGAFGRTLPTGTALARDIAAERGLDLDETYGAKAMAAAVARARREHGPTLYWVTFDARVLLTASRR